MISYLPNQASLLMESAVRSFMLALAVWVGLRIFRVRSVLAQKAAWGVVLAAALTMPIVLPMVAHWSVLPANVRVVIPADPQNLLEELQARIQANASPNVTPSATLPTAEAGPQDQQIAGTLPPEASAKRAADTVELDSSNDKSEGYLRSQPNPQPVAAAPSAAVPHHEPISMLTIILLLYLAVAGMLLVRVACGLLAAIRLMHTARPIAMDLLIPLAASFDLARSSRICCSTKVASPVTIFSSILLPADYRDWDSEKLRIVLAHERSHIRQGDFYLQLLAGIYAAVVWFSPLGWWLKRQLSDLAEAISDRAGLEEAADRTSYAQILLQFAAAPRPTVIGVAMARSGSLSRRIERLLNDVSFRQAFSGTRRSLLAVLVIPVALFAATALVRVEAAGQQAPAAPDAPAMPAAPTAGMPAPSLPPGAPAPDPAVAPVAPTAELSTPEEVSTEPVVASPPAIAIAPPAQAGVPEPAAPAPPAHISEPAVLMIAPPAAPNGRLTILAPKALRGPGSTSLLVLPPSAPGSHAKIFAIVPGEGQSTTTERGSSSHSDNGKHSGYHYSYSSNGQSYAVIRGNDTDHMTFSGNWIEGRRDEIEKARKQAKGDFLWFTHDGKSYFVDDPATLAQIEAMYKPMEELGRQQEELGKKQEVLGEQQEALGKQQEAVSVPTPDMSKQIAEIDEAMAKLKAEQGKNMNQEQFAEIQEKLGALQGRLGEMQGELGSRQGEFGAKMGELGEKMGELGSQQGRLGAEQGRLGREADQKVKSIIDESLKNGKAKPIQ